jgi:hypothetical protein
MTNQLRIAQDGSRAVVVAMEKGQRFFLEEQEYGIEELEAFGQIHQLSYY